MSAKHAKPDPAFKAQFEEVARLEQAVRNGELTGYQAVAALNRLYELMDWQTDADAGPDVAPEHIDYLCA
jgi:hypothetical protein